MNKNESSMTDHLCRRQYLSALSEPRNTREQDRVIEVTITTRDRDREGDVVEPSGLDFANFLKNPVVLWAHDLSSPPVGRVLSVSVLPERVDAEVQFADTEHGRECFTLYRERFLNAWSIGFIPRRWERIKHEEEGATEGGFHILEAEVVELSSVPVPANPAALTRALEKGRMTLSRKMLDALALDDKSVGPNETNSKMIKLSTAVDAVCEVARRTVKGEIARIAAAARKTDVGHFA